MRSGDGMMRALATGPAGARWGRVALLALALQARSAWLLLGVWVSAGSAGALLPFMRVRMRPTHPDWVLPALVESVVAALVVVGLAGRWRTGWALLAAAAAGGAAWAATSAAVPEGVAGFWLVFQLVREVVATGVLLALVAATWRRVGRWTAVPVVALAGGTAAGAVRLLLAYTSFGSGWPKEWPRELAGEIAAAALLAVAVAVLRGTTGPTQDAASSARAGRWAFLGTVGLLLLTGAHLVAGAVYSAWTAADARRLLVAAGVLVVLCGWTLVTSRRAARSGTA